MMKTVVVSYLSPCHVISVLMTWSRNFGSCDKVLLLGMEVVTPASIWSVCLVFDHG